MTIFFKMIFEMIFEKYWFKTYWLGSFKVWLHINVGNINAQSFKTNLRKVLNFTKIPFTYRKLHFSNKNIFPFLCRWKCPTGTKIVHWPQAYPTVSCAIVSNQWDCILFAKQWNLHLCKEEKKEKKPNRWDETLLLIDLLSERDTPAWLGEVLHSSSRTKSPPTYETTQSTPRRRSDDQIDAPAFSWHIFVFWSYVSYLFPSDQVFPLTKGMYTWKCPNKHLSMVPKMKKKNHVPFLQRSIVYEEFVYGRFLPCPKDQGRGPQVMPLFRG